ncbi:MAG TPA: tRNA (N6-isopentenyl adenosine(37)-C2)-methylthiotransferase MiaB, partial [Clostridia bacterium]
MGKDSQKRKNIQVPEEEVAIQRQCMEKIKEINYENELKTKRKRSFFLQSFGCQMNENDSERLHGMLSEMGYVETSERALADLIIFNTCCVRENAEDKVFGHIGALKKLKSENPDLIIAICGCMMQQKHVVELIKRKYRHVELIFGTHNLYKFPELVYEVMDKRTRVIDVWDSEGAIAEDMPLQRKDRIKAWLTVMYGCNNFCSYCIVPYVRGRERSRSLKEIIKEAEGLSKQGFKEITLLGQNVNSYGLDMEDNVRFADLLEELNKVEGISRIRFMTSHPKDLSDDLILKMAELKKVCLHLHLPIQSGSTKILHEMNRKYTKEQYLELVGKVKRSIPGIALTTDIIVGFPGETEDNFKDTLDVLEKVRFDSAYTFLYSKRTGTPAASMPEQVDEETKKDRFQRLLDVQNRISKEINDGYLGKVVEVLVEGASKNNPDKFTGRTDTNKVVNFSCDSSKIGKLVNVRIDSVQTWSL